MDIDVYGEKVDSLSSRIKKLKYKFKNEDNEIESEKLKEEAVALLEEWLELVSTDMEEADDEEDTEESD